MSKRRILVAVVGLVLLGPALAPAQAVKVKEESPGLLAKATVTPSMAMRTALARVPGGKVQSAEIEKEGGLLIYSFDIKVKDKPGIYEVHVNARTGAVVGKVEHEKD